MKNRRHKLGGIVIAMIMLLNLFPVTALAADTSANEHQHNMETMQHNSAGGHNMNLVQQGSPDGHDMNHMNHSAPAMSSGAGQTPAAKNDSHSAHEHGATENEGNRNPWPILYGFGGVNLAVILVAGIKKFTGSGNGVK